MIYINEWLPNPTGADSNGEWIELFNSGNETASLDKWHLVAGNGKKFVLGGKSIGAKDYLLLNRTETKLTLRNQNDSLFLYDGSGKLADQSSFMGSAPEGKSFARSGYETGEATSFVFTAPTPGAENKIVKEFLAAETYAFGRPLNEIFGNADVFWLALFVGLIYPFLILAIIKKNEYLSELFFGRD
ncbi:MAG: lamin tail domain-containing protein [Candidatus Liptonbacteria bacterium]|nr:lamin tail domain-containing protein [Candidatus Liptonbacteria bacterium]